MLIELIMFSAVVMVGIALLVSNPIKRVCSIATSMKVMVRAHLLPASAPGLEGHWQPSRADVQSNVQLSWASVARLTFSGRSVGRCARELSKALYEATPKSLHSPEENYSTPTVSFEDVHDKLPAHNRRVLR
jgi:hypothetical protein